MEDDKEVTPTCDNGEDHIDGDGRDRLNSESSVQTTGNVASDFVVVSNDEITRNEEIDEADEDESYGNALGSCGGRRQRRRLQSDGYTWSRQLLFRAKLTMHTAFERPDNIDPAAVTALAVSKDHRTIYVGDEKGRVFSWSVSSRPGKGMVDHWMKDEHSESCVDCKVKFTIYERKHHCRNCGKVFCSSCSQYQAEIPRLKIMQPVRVCKPCHTNLTKTKRPKLNSGSSRSSSVVSNTAKKQNKGETIWHDEELNVPKSKAEQES
jgi:hypothetical protein